MKIQNSQGTSLVVSVHLGTCLRYVHLVPKCHKVVHLGLDHVSKHGLLKALGVELGYLNCYKVEEEVVASAWSLS